MPISRGLTACLPALALVPAFSAAVSPAAAVDLWSFSCGDLWYQRNAIYARNGFCFKSDRGLRVFGNENCQYQVEADVPMSRAERRVVEMIRDVERQKGCQF